MTSQLTLVITFPESMADVMREAQELIEAGELGDARDNGEPPTVNDVFQLWIKKNFPDVKTRINMRDVRPSNETLYVRINRLMRDPRLLDPRLGDRDLADDLKVAMRRLRSGRLGDARRIVDDVEAVLATL